MEDFGDQTPIKTIGCGEIAGNSMDFPIRKPQAILRDDSLIRPSVFRHAGKRASESGNPKPLASNLPAVPGKSTSRQDLLRKMQTQPSPPRADLRPRAAHAAGEVLEMPHRVAQIPAGPVSGSRQNPCQCRIGRRIADQHRMPRRKVGHPGFIELEDRLRRLSGNPLGLGVTQRILIKRRSPIGAVPPRDGEIMDFTHCGKPWARWVHRRKSPARSARAPAKTMRTFSAASKTVCGDVMRTALCAGGVREAKINHQKQSRHGSLIARPLRNL